MGVLVEKRKKETSDSPSKSHKGLSKNKYLSIDHNNLKEKEEDDYHFNPFKWKITPVVMKDRSATIKEKEIALVTMNDI